MTIVSRTCDILQSRHEVFYFSRTHLVVSSSAVAELHCSLSILGNLTTFPVCLIFPNRRIFEQNHVTHEVIYTQNYELHIVRQPEAPGTVYRCLHSVHKQLILEKMVRQGARRRDHDGLPHLPNPISFSTLQSLRIDGLNGLEALC